MKNKKTTERRNLDINEINYKSKKDLSTLILESEKYYSDQIKEIIEEITSPHSNVKLLLIAGPSSAGKTTTSNLLRLELSMKQITSVVISLDNFFIDRRITPKLPNGSYDFENIKTLDLEYLNSFIDSLLKNHKGKMPTFNFFTGRREETYTDLVIDENTVIIIEGIHALNPDLIRGHEKELYRIYLSLNDNYVKDNELLLPAKQLRLIRRITRDFYTRGYSVIETISSWPDVCEGENKWIKPFKNTANYVIDSVHEYELLLYSQYAKPIIKDVILEKNVKNLLNSDLYKENKAPLLNSLNIAKDLYLILNEAYTIKKDKIPSTSLLWEFVGNAKDTIEPSGKIFG